MTGPIELTVLVAIILGSIRPGRAEALAHTYSSVSLLISTF